MIRRGNHLCLTDTDTLHFKKITPHKTTLSIIIKCGGILLFFYFLGIDTDSQEEEVQLTNIPSESSALQSFTSKAAHD